MTTPTKSTSCTSELGSIPTGDASHIVHFKLTSKDVTAKNVTVVAMNGLIRQAKKIREGRK